MKILLAACNAKYIHSNLAVFNLKAYAKEYDSQVVLREYTINQLKDDILKDIYRCHPDVVCVSCYIWNITFVRELMQDLRKILPDVPFEEKEEFASVFRKEGMDLISLIASTSHDRISMIAKEAEGFVYCVSSLGVTGMRSQITTDVGAMVELVKKSSDIPAAIGFGISGPEQAKKMAAVSDGVIVGSAIVKLVEKYGKDAVPYVAEFVKSVKDAIRE